MLVAYPIGDGYLPGSALNPTLYYAGGYPEPTL